MDRFPRWPFLLLSLYCVATVTAPLDANPTGQPYQLPSTLGRSGVEVGVIATSALSGLAVSTAQHSEFDLSMNDNGQSMSDLVTTGLTFSSDILDSDSEVLFAGQSGTGAVPGLSMGNFLTKTNRKSGKRGISVARLMKHVPVILIGLMGLIGIGLLALVLRRRFQTMPSALPAIDFGQR